MNQRFHIDLTLTTECEQTLTEAQVRTWLEEQLEGCDVGNVAIVDVEECQ